MAKLIWLGEDELHNGAPGPSFTTAFGGIKFPKGEPVEVTDKAIIAKARNHKYFEVTGIPGRPPKMNDYTRLPEDRADHEDPS